MNTDLPGMASYMNMLIMQLRFFAFASIAIAMMVEAYHRDALFGRRFIFIMCLIAAIASYNSIIDYGVEMFESVRRSAHGAFYLSLYNVRTAIDQGASKASWMEKIMYYIAYWGLDLCNVFAWLSGLLQQALVIIYKVCCPVALGLAAWRAMSGVAVKFAVGTLWLCMWSVATCIADLLMAKIALAAFSKAMLSAGSSAAAGIAAGTAAGTPLVVGVLVGIAVLFVCMFFFYIMIPFVMYALLSGGEIGQAASNAIKTAIVGGAAAGAGVSTAYRDAKRFGGGGGDSGANNETKKNEVKQETTTNSINSPSPSGSGSGTADSGTASAHAAMSDLADKQLAASKAMKGA